MTDRERLREDGVGVESSGATQAGTGRTDGTSRRTALKLAGLAAVGGGALAGAATPATAGGSGGRDASDEAAQVARLTAPDGQAGDQFGQAVDATADCERVLVGAAGESADRRTGAAYVYSVVDGEWTLTATLAPDGEDGVGFGAAVALDAEGRTALVGAPDTEGEGSGSGAAHLFTRGSDGWTRVRRIDADEVEFTDAMPEGTVGRFGAAVALDADGDTAQVGAPLSDRPAPSSGATYLFEADDDSGAWTQTGEVIFGGGDSTYAGSAVALDAAGSLGVAGVTNDFPGRTGHVAVFDADDDGVAETTLTDEEEPELNVLGTSVVTDDAGELIVAGAPGSPVDDPRAGRAHAFAREDGEWTAVAAVLPDDGQVDDACGSACDLDGAGETLLVGAPNHDAAAGEAAGAAYVFEDEAWAQSETLVPESGATASAEFGAACALGATGTIAAVGAPLEDTDDGEDAGAIYVFDLETASDGDDGHDDEDGGKGEDGDDESDGQDGSDEGDGDGDGGDDETDDSQDENDGDGSDDEDGTDDGTDDDGDDGTDDDGDDETDDGEEEIDVEVAVRPEGADEPVNPRSRGTLPVAILQTDAYDPTDDETGVDVSTIRVGTPGVVDDGDGATPAHDGHVEDVDGDGDDDLLVHVPVRDAELDWREERAKLVAETRDGRTVVGSADVDVMHCWNPS